MQTDLKAPYRRLLAGRLAPGAPSPCGAGLSHVSEKFEEEGIVPSGTLELASQGDGLVRVGSGDVESEASEHSETGWSVIPAIAGQILAQAKGRTFYVCRLPAHRNGS
jgi:hypothetical protein